VSQVVADQAKSEKMMIRLRLNLSAMKPPNGLSTP